MPGLLHHVTQRGNKQQLMFQSVSDGNYFLEKLHHYASKAELYIAAYCLMPNHTHLLVIPKRIDSLARTFRPLHMCYSQRLNRRAEQIGVNWQGRFFSCVMDEVHAWHAFKYVMLNPAKAGLVRRAVEYRWSSIRAHLNMGSDPILTAEEYWLEMAAASIREIGPDGTFEQRDEFTLIAKRTSMNLPCGEAAFIQKLEIDLKRRLNPAKAGRPKSGTQPNLNRVASPI
jgi:putative transposase